MTIAVSVENYLSRAGVHYDVIGHARTADSAHSAQAAHVPGDQLAKGIVLKDEQGFLIAVVPASHRVDLGTLHRQLHRPLGLATEHELAGLFGDCEPGAIPALGAAYGIETILDESLASTRDIYFEAGDHRELVHVSGSDFLKLMADTPRAKISRHA